MIQKLKWLLNGILNPKEDRNLFRLRGILYTAISTLGAKAVNLMVQIVTVPLTYNYLSEERFGMMMTILSILMMLSFADLGLGLGLLNRIAEFEESKDKSILKKAISSTFFLLLGVSLIFSFFFILILPIVEWHNVFNVTSILAKEEALASMQIFGCCFLVSLPFSIIQKVQGGFQEGYYNNIWEGVGNVLGLGLIFFFTRQNLGVPALIFAIYGTRVFSIILNFIAQFFFIRPQLRPSLFFIDWDILLILLKDGIIFFILQLCAMLGNASDSIIIAYFLGAKAVAVYAIGYRLVTIFLLPIQAFISPLLPAYNDAFSRNDYKWVQKSLSRIIKILLLGSFLFFILLLFLGNTIIRFWINEEVVLTISLLISFGFYIFYSNYNSYFSYIMLTPRFIKFLIKIYPLAAIVAVALKVILVKPLGISGILWSSIIAFSFLFFIPTFIKLKQEKFLL